MPKTGMLVRTSLALAAVAVLATLAVSAAGAARQSVTLKGAGSTFVVPLINSWTQLPSPSQSPYTKASGNTVTYGGGGSGAGVAGIVAKTIDFGASDAPLTAFASTCTTCYQMPWGLSGTAMIYRIDNVKPATAVLKMTGAVLAKIYLGQIHYWDDKQIKAINKGLTIPHTLITTVHRDSSSGTTYNFTDYLSHVSSFWKSHYGAQTLIGTWPGNNQQAHGSSGVDAAVKATNGAVGYVDVYYGKTAHLKFMFMQNRSGKYVQPTTTSILAASKLDTTPAADGSLSIVNPPSSVKYHGAYPISTYTYVDVQQHSGSNAGALKGFLTWAVTTGQTYAVRNIFVPIASPVVTFDKKQIAKIKP
jgi:phosphate transport system substrate-binding protein